MTSPRRGEIHRVNLDATLGTEIARSRPALIISNDVGNQYSERVIVAPLTSQHTDRVYPFEEDARARIAEGQGYRLQWSRQAHAGRTCFLSYRNALGAPDRIEEDLDFLPPQRFLPSEVRHLWSPEASARVAAPVLSLPELCAFLDRMAPRGSH